MNHLEGTFKGVGGLSLYYQSWMPDAPKAIVLIIHGFGEHSGRYLNVVNNLVPEGFGIYAFDLRGHGKSEGVTNYVDSFDQFLEDAKIFHALIREKYPNLPIFLLGHSMGSGIAVYFTQKYENLLNGLILSGCGTVVGEDVSAFLKLMAGFLSKVAGKMTVDTKLDPASLSHDPAVVKAYIDDPLVHYQKITTKLAREMMIRFPKIPSILSEFRIPVLIQKGGDDKAVSGIQNVIDALKTDNFEYHVYSGLYHEVYNEVEEKRKVVFDDLKKWLAKQALK